MCLVNHGWRVTDSVFLPALMTQAPAPKELIESIVCQCEKSKCAPVARVLKQVGHGLQHADVKQTITQ